jgi:hypothetical protein
MTSRSLPTAFKLAPLWKCAGLKSPGNLLVVQNGTGPVRLLVIEAWKSVAEVGLDGKVIAVHKLNVADRELIGSLRSAVGADGKRYVVAFFQSQQRCHVLDDNWNLVTSYPEDALKNPHSGIADVELGDLDGDGRLKLYVSYWGVVGVQAASLDGKRLWSNRILSNASSMAFTGPDSKRRCDLVCTNNTGPLVVLDAQGQRRGEILVLDAQSQRRGEIPVPNRVFFWIASADLRGNGQTLWCGRTDVNNGAVGFSTKGEELWSYKLPHGVQQQPIEPIIAGKMTREGPGQWILPGPDGSIHFVSADGKPWDKFNYGVALCGLATVEIDGRPVLVVASPNGLEAWKVE